jgi:hypothetical protein
MSVTPLANNFGMTVPSPHPIAVTVITVPVVDTGDKEHPDAVPLTVKSEESRPVIASFIVNTNVGDVAFVGVVDGMNEDTVALVLSIVTVALVTAVAGPVFAKESTTVDAFCLRITVPSPQPVKDTLTTVPLAALTVPALHPVAVPNRVKSPMTKPDIVSL